VLPCIDVYSKIDLRTVSFDVPPQEVIIQYSIEMKLEKFYLYCLLLWFQSVLSGEIIQEKNS
jgi:hypothetical protein